MANPELFDVHHSSLYLHQLCLSWDHHDVVIISSEGAKVPAHKLILLSRSDYFKKMFANNTYSDENPVVLPYSSECIKQILRFLYSGKLNLSYCHFRVLLELMDASRMMLMYSVSEDERGGIADYIEHYIIAQVFGIPEDDYIGVEIVGDKESFLVKVVEILNYSISYRFPTLMNASICCLKDIDFLFLQSEAFSNLSFPALFELLRLDALADSDEVVIFSAVERWLNFSQGRMDQKVFVLQLIRFDQISVSEIFDTVKPSGFLEDKELLEIIESIVRKDNLKVDNSRHIVGRWGCMEKVHRVPMWIREMSVNTFRPSRAPQVHWADKKFQTILNKKPLTELGFSVVLNESDTESDDGDYISEEDSTAESDYSSDEDETGVNFDYFHSTENTLVIEDVFQSQEELNDYIIQRDLL